MSISDMLDGGGRKTLYGSAFGKGHMLDQAYRVFMRYSISLCSESTLQIRFT